MALTDSPTTSVGLVGLMLNRGKPVMLLTDQHSQPRVLEPIERREPLVSAIEAFLAYELREISGQCHYGDIQFVQVRNDGTAHIVPATRLAQPPRPIPGDNPAYVAPLLDLHELVSHAADLRRGGSSRDDAAQSVIAQHAAAGLIYWSQVRLELLEALEADTERQLSLSDSFVTRLTELTETNSGNHTSHIGLLVEFVWAALR
ncbi:MAG TPA: hypothetical protein VLI05_03920 [Candidatus Saccharimonadia bacterium]|nr:hypothetical protein [Candidatus Saccharimonadia bacterium]